MGFIKMLIGLPILVVIVVFAVVNNDFATFSIWPFDIEITVSLSVAVIFFILLGFILGKADSWMSYAPLRRALRQQKKQNKKLNKEQQKLVKEMEGLHDNINTLKEEKAALPKPPLKERFKNFFRRKPKKDNA